MEKENVFIMEKWEVVSDKTFEGSSKFITYNSDSTLFSESLRIMDMNNQIFYLSKVRENNLPIAFKKKFIDDRSVIFENEKHDFPQKIEYIKLNNDSMKVIISLLNGESKREFRFKRND